MNPLVETGIELLVKPLIGELQAERKMQRQLKELAFKQRLDIETARVNQEMSFQYEQKLLEKKFQDNLALKEQDLRDRLKEWSDKEDFKNCWPLTNTYQNKALVAEPNSKNARPVRIFITLPEESNYLSVIKSVNKTLETYFSYSNFNPNSENPLTSRIGAWKEEKGFNTSNNINVLFQWLKLQPCIVINPVFRKDKADIYIYSWSPFYKENEPTPQRWFTWDIPENETGLEEKLTTSIALLIGFYTDLYHLVEIGAQPQMPMAFKKFCDENAFPYEIPEDIINSYKTTLYGITYTNWLGEKLPLTYLNMAKSLHSIGTDYAIQVSKQLFIEGVGIWANRKSEVSKEIRLPKTLDDCIRLLRDSAKTTDKEYLENVKNDLLMLGESNAAKKVDEKIEQLQITEQFEKQYEMVFVQGGTFTMGATPEQGRDCSDNEKPAHRVTVSDYYIGKYPVTQAVWKLIMGSYPSELYNKGCDNCPVEGVSWNDAQEFIGKLNATKTNGNYRLPTEAEWEFAARGGNQSKGYKYSGGNTMYEVSWYRIGDSGNSKHGTEGTTDPVGTKKPNELGICNMSDNVCEWCNDWYDSYSSKSQNNPIGPSTGRSRVTRGGSWGDSAKFCRVSSRSYCEPSSHAACIGFRLARSL